MSWRYQFYTTTEVFDDTIPSYYLESFPESHFGALLKKTTLTQPQKDKISDELNSFKIKLIKKTIEKLWYLWERKWNLEQF